MKAAATPLRLWRYTLRWRYPHRPCPGPVVIARVEVPVGAPCSDTLLAGWRVGGDCCVCVDFDERAPVRSWSADRKAVERRRRLDARVRAAAPLFADELIERALADRADYFAGRSTQ